MIFPPTTIPLSRLRLQAPASYRRKVDPQAAWPLFSLLTPPIPSRPGRGKRGQGIRFERKVLQQLEASPLFLSSPVLRYISGGLVRYCIPDGLLFSESEIIIVEVKLRHTVASWFQTQNLYAPVVEKAFGRKTRAVEIVKWYDSEERLPVETKLFKSLETFCAEGWPFGVVLWRSNDE